MPFNLPTKLNQLNAKHLISNVDNFLFDCDGVIWNWPNVITGSVECINKLKSLGKKCFFVTNNSTKTRKTLIEMIHKVGIQNATEDDIVCTAWVLAGYLKSIDFKHKVYAIASQAVATELDNLQIRYIGIGCNRHKYPDPATHNYQQLDLDPEVKCVTVGFDHHFNYLKMVEATTYAHKVKDCLFIATNDDSVLPTGPESSVVIPGTGTFVNAMKTSIGREPITLGKPYKTMWEVLAKTHCLDPHRSCMVGDRLDTDIAFAANCSLGFSLAVLSGVTNEIEIENYADKMKKLELTDEQAKLLPDFYIGKLGDLEVLLNEEQE